MTRTVSVVVALALSAAGVVAQERLSEQVRRGAALEEGRDVERAIAAYEAAVAQFDADRAAAATALFRLAECYRATGRRELAIAAYQRVVREFPDQGGLADASRRQLAGALGVGVAESPAPATAEETLRRRRELSDSRALDPARVRAEASGSAGAGVTSVQDGERRLAAARAELDLLERRLGDMRTRVSAGTVPAASLADLERQLSEASVRYDDLLAGRRTFTEVPEPGGPTRESLAGVEQQMALVERRLRTLQQEVAAGTRAADDRDLLGARAELAELQQRAAELRKK